MIFSEILLHLDSCGVSNLFCFHDTIDAYQYDNRPMAGLFANRIITQMAKNHVNYAIPVFAADAVYRQS